MKTPLRRKFWERNALSIELSTEKVFQQKLNYIHENPVKAGLCELPESYRYSGKPRRLTVIWIKSKREIGMDVEEYIIKQKSPQKEICQRLRQILFKTFPHIKEEMKWGVPSYGKGNYYFVSLKSHVNLGFSIKGLLKEEIALFKGSGKTMKHIEIHSLDEIDEKYIVKLLRLIKDE